MKAFALLPALAAAVALVASPASAAPKHHRHHHVTKAAHGAYARQPEIACSVAGCQPVPPGCHREMGYTPDGTPTGFDVAVCRNGAYTLYGNRR
jgi:predicted amidohydrolase